VARVEQDAFDRTAACPRSHASAGARNAEGYILGVTHLHFASRLYLYQMQSLMETIRFDFTLRMRGASFLLMWDVLL
jgi:hypothetical protein